MHFLHFLQLAMSDVRTKASPCLYLAWLELVACCSSRTGCIVCIVCIVDPFWFEWMTTSERTVESKSEDFTLLGSSLSVACFARPGSSLLLFEQARATTQLYSSIKPQEGTTSDNLGQLGTLEFSSKKFPAMKPHNTQGH